MIGHGSKAQVPHLITARGGIPNFAATFTKNSGTTIFVAKFSRVSFAKDVFNLPGTRVGYL